MLITGSVDRTIKIAEFDRKDGLKLVQTLVGHTAAVRIKLFISF